MTARRVIVPGAMPSRDANGRALPAKLRFYQPNTAYSTQATVYTTSALTVAHSWPLLSDSSGRFPAVWADDENTFDVAWSDQTFDRQIAAYADLSPLSDAVLASVDLADAAAEAAETAQAAAEAAQAGAEATADELGDLASAISAAEASASAAADSAEAAAASAEAAATWDPTNYVQYTRQVATSGLASGGGNLSADRTINVPAAAASDVQTGSNTSKALTAAALMQSSAFQTLTDAATIAWNVAGGYNARVTLTASGHTVGAPTSLSDGQTIGLEIIQDATGSRTVSWNAMWDFGAAGQPLLQTGANKADRVFGQYNGRTGKIDASFRKGA